MGPLPTTESGHKYILFVVDYFTIWPEAFSLSNQEAATVAEVLVKEYVCRYGVLLSLHSDQGPLDSGDVPSLGNQEDQDHPLTPSVRWSSGEYQPYTRISTVQVHQPHSLCQIRRLLRLQRC